MSLVLHGMLVVALLLVARQPEQEAGGATAPSYDLVFDTPQTVPPSAAGQPDTAPPTPGPAPTPTAPPPPAAPKADDAPPGPQTQAPTAPPAPNAPILPQTPPTEPQPSTQTAPAQTPPTQAVPAQTAPAQPPALAQPDPAPPAPSPPTQAAPPEAAVTPEPAPLPPHTNPSQVNIEVPTPEPPPPPLVPELVLPTPPPPLPPIPPRPAPQRPRTAPPQIQAGTLGSPLDSLNFGPSAARPPAARVGARPGSIASRSLDLSPGAPKGPNHAEAFFDARAARLGTDWEEALKSYWLRHRYYPQQAAENGEDGTVDLELTVSSTGRVQSAVIKSRSGSQFIDMAAIGTWRNAQLPPLPPELGANYTFTITIDYVLLR